MLRALLIISLATTSLSAEPLHIGTIAVRISPLFNAAEGGNSGIYRLADRLQVTTRERLIREFLLFREGDELDEALLNESERNLRQLDFLDSVSVTHSSPHDGVVNVTVETHDAFTTALNADFSNDGGRSLFDVDITQKNLFNRAADIDLRVANTLFRRTTSLEFIDPEMYGPYWTGDFFTAVSTDGNEERVSIERPLYSYTTRLTALASADHLLQNARTYQSGFVDSIFRQSHSEIAIQAGDALRGSPSVSTRLLAGIDFVDDSFRAISGTAPDQRRFRWLEIGVDHTRFNFVTLDHVDYGLRKQDFNLGAHAAVFAALSPSGAVGRIRGDLAYGRKLGTFSFLLASAKATSRIHTPNRNASISEDARLIVKLTSNYPSTFIAHAAVDFGWNLDRDVQFIADGQNGLRAYPDFSFEGTRRILFNAEHRIFLGREVFDLAEPGAAVFIDSGRAFSSGVGRPATDAGAGLRLSIARLDNAMLRLDFAYAFNDSPTQRRGFQISFATTAPF